MTYCFIGGESIRSTPLETIGDVPFARSLEKHFGDRVSEISEDLIKKLHALWTDGVALGSQEACANCGSQEEIRLENARTLYTQKEGEPDPNAPIPFCRPCAQEHHDHWDELWDSYHSGLM